jgi:hypothetical protein
MIIIETHQRKTIIKNKKYLKTWKIKIKADNIDSFDQNHFKIYF